MFLSLDRKKSTISGKSPAGTAHPKQMIEGNVASRDWCQISQEINQGHISSLLEMQYIYKKMLNAYGGRNVH